MFGKCWYNGKNLVLESDRSGFKSWLLHMTLSKSNESEALLMEGFGRPPGGSAYQTPGEHLVREPVPDCVCSVFLSSVTYRNH